jgi:hypothetical protein
MTPPAKSALAQRLVDITAEHIGVGAVFVFPVYDFRAGEKYAELMLMQSSAEGAVFEFLPISGYESGKRFGAFVLENYVEDANKDAIKTQWLKNNWNRVVYLDSKVSEVFVFRREPQATYPPINNHRHASGE